MAARRVSIADDESRPIAGVDVDDEAPRVIVRLWGEHDMASAAMITEAFVDAVDNSDAEVLVDLTAVVFMDCSTVRVLVSARDTFTQRSRRLTVRVSPIGFAHRILLLCGLGDMVEPTTAAGQPGGRDVVTALESWVEVPRAAPDCAAAGAPQPDPLHGCAAGHSQPSSGPVAWAGPRHVR